MSQESELNLFKACQMPDVPELTERIRNAVVLEERVLSFYDMFINTVAGRSQSGRGLLNAWEFSSAVALESYHPTVRAIVSGDFNDVMDAIVPDPEVAEQAKEVRKEMYRQAKEKAQQG